MNRAPLRHLNFYLRYVTDEVDESHQTVDFLSFQVLTLYVLNIEHDVDLQLKSNLVVIRHKLLLAARRRRLLRLLAKILQTSQRLFGFLN